MIVDSIFLVFSFWLSLRNSIYNHFDVLNILSDFPSSKENGTSFQRSRSAQQRKIWKFNWDNV